MPEYSGTCGEWQTITLLSASPYLSLSFKRPTPLPLFILLSPTYSLPLHPVSEIRGYFLCVSPPPSLPQTDSIYLSISLRQTHTFTYRPSRPRLVLTCTCLIRTWREALGCPVWIDSHVYMSGFGLVSLRWSRCTPSLRTENVYLLLLLSLGLKMLKDIHVLLRLFTISCPLTAISFAEHMLAKQLAYFGDCPSTPIYAKLCRGSKYHAGQGQ
jgi:hypothetical protein